MNWTRVVHSAMAASLSLIVSGCLEVETTTTVRTDGTLERELRTGGDSSEVSRRDFVFPTDSTWTITRRKEGDTSWVAVATKIFPDGAALEKASNVEGGKSPKVSVRFDKKFRWFTTEFEYRETIVCYNQFHAVPISDYISQADQDRWIHHEVEKVPYASREDSLSVTKVSERAEEWDARNMFEAYFAVFAEGVQTLNDPALPRSSLAAAKETLFARTSPIFIKSRTHLDTLQSIFEGTLGTPVTKKVYALQSGKYHEFADKLRYEMDIMGTPYKRARIVMPGLITETNARSIEGNRLEWKDFMGACYVIDYPMWARSRVINWWAVVLTGGVVILLTGILVAGALRRKGQ
jgi:hypothetical protein